MDFIKAVSIIGRDLEEAIALLDQLSAEGGSNVAEIELARLRVRSAAELLRLLPALEKTNIPGPPHETGSRETKKVLTETRPVSEPEKAYEPVKPAPEPLTIAGAVNQADTPSPTDEPVRHVSGQVTEEIDAAKVTVEAAKAAGTMPEASGGGAKEAPGAKTADQHKTQEPQKSILADRFPSAGTLGEKMQSAKQEGAISSVMHSKPIADIGAAIGMNDKFYFIRELFSGDTIAYHDTIGRLNAATSLGEAMKILDESTVMGSDPSAQSSFVDVVRRKFNIHV